MKTQLKTRPLLPSNTRQPKECPDRDWLIRRAKQRIASGFYDSDECLDVVIEQMLATRPRSAGAGRSAGVSGSRGRRKPTNRAA